MISQPPHQHPDLPLSPLLDSDCLNLPSFSNMYPSALPPSVHYYVQDDEERSQCGDYVVHVQPSESEGNNSYEYDSETAWATSDTQWQRFTGQFTGSPYPPQIILQEPFSQLPDNPPSTLCTIPLWRNLSSLSLHSNHFQNPANYTPVQSSPSSSSPHSLDPYPLPSEALPGTPNSHSSVSHAPGHGSPNPGSRSSLPATPEMSFHRCGSESSEFLPSPSYSAAYLTSSPTSPHYSQSAQPTREQLSPVDARREQIRLFREAVLLPTATTAGPFIPQTLYVPHTNSDRRRYVEEIELQQPIYFWMQEPEECGIPLSEALHSRVRRLQFRDDPVFEGRGPSISVRIQWPGYRPWSRQIPTKDFRSPPGPITRAKLVKNVAKCVERFLQVVGCQPFDEETDRRWKVGSRPHEIKLDDLILVSMHHVSMGSWQPHLRLRRPFLL